MSAIAQLCGGLAIDPTPENAAASLQEQALSQIEATSRDETNEWMLEAAQVESYPSLGLYTYNDFDMAPSDTLTAA